MACRVVVHCHVEERHLSAANLIDCCELLVISNQTIMLSTVIFCIHSMSFRQKICENKFLSVQKNALSAADRFCPMQCFNTDIITN